MARVASNKKAKPNDVKLGALTKESLAEYIQDISQKSLTPEESLIHCVISLNQILADEETSALLNEDMKSQLREIWLKLKSAGIQLVDPPALFGLPEDFSGEEIAN